MEKILVDADVCSGCRACQIACVARHEGRFGTALARIRIVKNERAGIDVPNVCRLCRPADCVEACPTEALYLDDITGVVRVEADACAGCGACADACPYGVITLHPATGQPLICDLCDGEPACVARCATGAIRFGEEAAVQGEAVERITR